MKMNIKETHYFKIQYNESDESCVDKISEVLDTSFDRITNKLNRQLTEKLIVEVHSEAEQLHKALGLTNAPNWIRGGINGGKIIIASPLSPPPGSNFDNVVSTAVHEFVHVLVNTINRDIPRWLDEGIASFEAKDNSENWIKNTVREGLLSNSVPSFLDLDTGGDFETFFKRNGYQYSYTIVEMIVEVFGYEKLNLLIRNPGDYRGIFGISEEALQSKWIEYLKENYLNREVKKMKQLSFSPFPTLETKRLVLRNLELKDAEFIFRYQSDKENFPHVDMPIYTDIAEAKAYIEKMNVGVEDNKWIIWAITDKNTKQILGTISIWNISAELDTADLGYGLFSEGRGRGIMSEALKEVVKYGLDKMRLVKIEACTNTLNQKSKALLKRNGFRYSSTFKESTSTGETIKMDVYSITPK